MLGYPHFGTLAETISLPRRKPVAAMNYPSEVPDRIRKLFPEAGHDRLWLVGGSVRDLQLGRPGQDFDLITTLPEGWLRANGFHPVRGKTTAPIWFRFHPQMGKIEVTRLTAEVSLEDDLARRDFTINAQALSLNGTVYDPLGGRDDLSQGILRACSERGFSDDPLRIFRGFRFEAEGWRMESATEALIRGRDWSEPLRRIPAERFSRELLKALEKPEPERFFTRMLEFNCGTGQLPELFRMPQIPAGPPERHPEGDLLSHALRVLGRMARRTGAPLPRFCAFFHDLGKLATPAENYPRHAGHDLAGVPLARALCNRLRLPARYRAALMTANRLHTTANRWDKLPDEARIELAEQARQGGIETILPLLVAADLGNGPPMTEWDEALRMAALNTADLGIDPARLADVPGDRRREFIRQQQVAKWRALRGGKDNAPEDVERNGGEEG